MWIPFIPLFVCGVMLKMYQALFDSKGVDVGLLSGGTLSLGFGVVVIATFLLLFIIARLDKKTSAYYDIKRNIPVGVCALLAAVLMFMDTAMMFSGGVNVINMVDALFTVLGGIGIVMMGISSFLGANKGKKLSYLVAVLPALWGFERTFITFINDTTIASESRDMTDIVYMAAATMLLFCCGMLYSGATGSVMGRNAVKGCFVYGMVTLLVSTAYAVSHTVYYIKIGSFDLMSNVRMYEFFAISLFALFLLIELTRGMRERTRKEYEEAGISLKRPEEEEDDEEYYAGLALEEKTSDPIMLKAEETVKSAVNEDDTAEFLKKYSSGIESNAPELDLNAVEFGEEYVDDDASDGEENMTYVDYVNDDDDDDKSAGDEADSASTEDGTAAQSGAAVDIADVDLENIDRLINEITGD